MKQRQAFVIMPFDEADAPQSLFHDVLMNLPGWEAHRVDKNYNEPDGLCAICKDMQESEVIIADLSTINPNVMLELGMAFGMGVPYVLMTQNHDELKETFDIMRLRAIKYERDPISAESVRGSDQLQERLLENLSALDHLKTSQSDFFETRKSQLLEKTVASPVYPPKMNLGLLVGPVLSNQELFPSREAWVEELFGHAPGSNDVKGYPNYTFVKYPGTGEPIALWNTKAWPSGILEITAEMIKSTNNDVDLVTLTAFVLDQVLFLYRAFQFRSWTGVIKIMLAVGGINDTPLQVYYGGHRHLDNVYQLPDREPWLAMTVEGNITDETNSVMNLCRNVIREVALCFGFRISDQALNNVFQSALSSVTSHRTRFTVGGMAVPIPMIPEDAQ